MASSSSSPSPSLASDQAPTLRMTQIARAEDGLVLVGSVERSEVLPDRKQYERQAKSLFKEMKEPGVRSSEARRITIENPPNYNFHVLLTDEVFYLTLCDRRFPVKNAFQYLEDLRREFESVHGPQVASARSIYSMQKFDSYISHAKRVFSDFRPQKDLEQVNSVLGEVQNVMKTNIHEVLGRGEKLEEMQNLSSELQQGSSMFRAQSSKINQAALWRKWGVFIVPALLFFLFILFRYVL